MMPMKKKNPAKTLFKLLLFIAIVGVVYYFFIADSGRNNPLAGPAQPTIEHIADVLLAFPTAQENIVEDTETGVQYVNNELLLTVNQGVSRNEVETFIKTYGAVIVGYDQYLNKYQIQFDSEHTLQSLDEIRVAFNNSELFTETRINLSFTAQLNMIPDDREWKSDWGNSPSGKNWGVEAINASDMWGINRVMTASPVSIGVLDNQFYTEHEDLKFADTFSNNFHPNDLRHGGNNPNRTVAHHGTHVAGTIAATFNNGKGIAGVAPRVNLYAASMLGLEDRDRKNNEYGLTINEIEAGLTYLICIAECKVINFSYMWGDDRVAEELTRSLLIYIQDYGYDFVIVKAAGNDLMDAIWDALAFISNPTIKDRIIVVGAAELSQNGDIFVAEYSNYGSRVGLIVPGSEIYSTVYQPLADIKNNNLDINLTHNGYSFSSGTSMAAPHVAGVAAVMWSVNPNLSGAQIKNLICNTASGQYGYDSSVRRNDTYRMLNAYEAVKAANGGTDSSTSTSGITNGTYISNDGLLSQTWVFSGTNEVSMKFNYLIVNSSGTYRLDGDRLYITNTLFGQTATSAYNISQITSDSFYIDGELFKKK